MFGADGDPSAGWARWGDAMGGMMGGASDPDGPADDDEADDGGLGSLLGGTMPGADEAAAMRQLLEYLDDPRFDRVIVDTTAPTGHTLRLLQLPEIMDSMIGRVMKLRNRFSGMMDGIKGMFGGGDDDPDPLPTSTSSASGSSASGACCRIPKTDFRVVTIPGDERHRVRTARRAPRDEFGIPVNTPSSSTG